MPAALDDKAFITPAPLPSKSEIGILCSTFKQVVEIIKQTFKKGAGACQSCYGAEQSGDEYQCLTKEEEEDLHTPIIHRGRGRRAGQSNYQAPPDHQPLQAREPTLAETVHDLALVQQKMMEELTRLKSETQGVLSQMMAQLTQLAQVIEKLQGARMDSPTQARLQPNVQVNAIQLKSEEPCPDKSRRKSRNKAKTEEDVQETKPPEAITLPEEIVDTKEWGEPPFSAWISNQEENKSMQYMVKTFKKVDVNTPLIKKLNPCPDVQEP